MMHPFNCACSSCESGRRSLSIKFLLSFLLLGAIVLGCPASAVHGGKAPAGGFFRDVCSDGSVCDEGWVCPGPMQPPGADCESAPGYTPNTNFEAKRFHRHWPGDAGAPSSDAGK